MNNNSNKRQVEFSDEVALVTGSTQGLGKSIATLFVERGIKSIVITGRNEKKGESFKKELQALGARAIFFKADLQNYKNCEKLINEVDKKFGKINILVNSAAITDRGTILSTTPELFDKMIQINLKAPFFLIQHCAKIMRREKIQGSIVSISSMVAHGGPHFLAAYNLSKSALNNLTKTTAYALMRDKIRVNALNLGWMDTPGEHNIRKKYYNSEDNWIIDAEKTQPLGRLIKTSEVAKTVAFLCSKEAGLITGSNIDFDQSVSGVPGQDYDPPVLKDSILGN